jgi:ParB-like nuclease domain
MEQGNRREHIPALHVLSVFLYPVLARFHTRLRPAIQPDGRQRNLNNLDHQFCRVSRGWSDARAACPGNGSPGTSGIPSLGCQRKTVTDRPSTKATIALITKAVSSVLGGHHRIAAARRVGLAAVPCWVREMDDQAAYMTLATSNSQSELTAIERGVHALHSEMDGKAYAASVGRPRRSVADEICAARVFQAVADVRHDLWDRVSQLVAIHAAPDWLWPALVDAMAEGRWTVETTRARVAKLKDVPLDMLTWAKTEVAADLVSGDLPVKDIARIEALLSKTDADIAAAPVPVWKPVLAPLAPRPRTGERLT